MLYPCSDDLHKLIMVITVFCTVFKYSVAFTFCKISQLYRKMYILKNFLGRAGYTPLHTLHILQPSEVRPLI